jgi:peptidoglycan/LPS O-acetylase OafA/YrhL
MHNHRKFDAFRGIAALIVVFSHVCQIYFVRLIGWRHPAWLIARTFGWHAVLIFFLLSGYLITLSILRNRESINGFDGKDFVAARLARIYPPFLVSLGLVVICRLALHAMHLSGEQSRFGLPTDAYAVGPMTFRPQEIVTSLAMIRGMTGANPPFWSLYFEVWAYAIAFAFALGFFSRHRSMRCVGLPAGLVALGAASLESPNFVFFLGIWVFGAVVCLLTHYRYRYRDVFLMSIATISTLVVAVLALINPRTLCAGFPVHAVELSVATAFAGIYGYMLFGFRALDRPYPQWLVHTGGFSYTLYVVHFPILAFGLACTLSWIGTSLGRTALCGAIISALDVAFARAIAKHVERPKYFKKLLLQARLPFFGVSPFDRE